MGGPVTRTRAMQREYINYLATRPKVDCIFCLIPDEQPETIVEETANMLVVENRFGYYVWEGCEVTEHLMVLPKRHRSKLSEFTTKEQQEWTALCAAYEEKGYSLYTRSPENITKSIAHHHTHFIKLDTKPRRTLRS
jgi:diadenosine tetraphosphate (Ap4A) HIT family hydrolase